MVTSEPTYQGPDNHADWCHTQHDGFCVDELLAAIDRKRREDPEFVERTERAVEDLRWFGNRIRSDPAASVEGDPK